MHAAKHSSLLLVIQCARIRHNLRVVNALLRTSWCCRAVCLRRSWLQLIPSSSSSSSPSTGTTTSTAIIDSTASTSTGAWICCAGCRIAGVAVHTIAACCGIFGGFISHTRITIHHNDAREASLHADVLSLALVCTRNRPATLFSAQPQLHHGFLTRSKWAASTARHYSVGKAACRATSVSGCPAFLRVNTPLLSCSVLRGVLVGGASRACLWRLQHPPSAMDDGSVSEFMSLQHPSSVRSPQSPRAPVRPFSHVPRRCGCVRLSGCICACMCLCLLCVCARCMGDRRCWRLQGC